MKILIINDYATLTGGAEILTMAIRDELRQRGHDARLFASSARPLGGGGFADYKCFGTTSSIRTLLQVANPWSYVQLFRVLREFQPDVVHVKMFLSQHSPLILPLLRDIPSIYHVVWYRPICPLGTKMLPDGSFCRVPAGVVCYRNRCLPLRDWFPLMFQMKLWRRWREAFNLIVANSEWVKRNLTIEDLGPTEVVLHGIRNVRQRPPLSSPATVGFAGRLVREKGVDVLLRAFTRIIDLIPEARLLILGDGPEREYLGKLIVDLKLSSSVSMLGHLPRSEMEQIMSSAWVQAVPSRWAEPYGLVAIEAMMRGTAVVASSSGGLAEIIQHGENGFIVQPDDIDSLSETLLLLLQNHELAEQIGRAGRRTALRNFRLDGTIDKFVRMYETLSGGKERQNDN